jgi:DNA helicase-2/ATP-dependent DNA helicase PcrA
VREDNFQKAISLLNTDQKKAVEQIYGPVMVVAGPGTGKTQILALRIAYILHTTDTLPRNILCLTFTEAGAFAMRERLRTFIGTDAYKVEIHTFHSFANTIIQDYPDYFEFKQNPVQLDDITRIKIIRSIIDSEDINLEVLRPFYNKYSKQGSIIGALQDIKKEGITPDELSEKINKINAENEDNKQLNKKGEPTLVWKRRAEKIKGIIEFVEVYKAYQKALRDEGLYDYDDMIMFVIDALKNNPDLLSHYQETFLFIHVDEYQDTNGAQNRLLNLLAQEQNDLSPNVFVVGDDDQAIYRFQGANIENILHFDKAYQDNVVIPIRTNYRSTKTILNAAQSVISKNTQRLVNRIKTLDKTLVPAKTGDKELIDVYEFINSDNENIFIANEIKKLVKEGVNHSDIAILYRKNAHGYEIANVLEKFDVPTKRDVTKTLFENPYVEKLLDILSLVRIYGDANNELFYRVLLFDFFNIPVHEVYEYTSYAYANKLKLIDLAIGSYSEKEYEEFTPSEDISAFVKSLFEWHELSVNTQISYLVEKIIRDTDMIRYIEGQTEFKNAPKGEISHDFNDLLAIISFYEFIKNQEKANERYLLDDLLKDIDLMQESRISVSISKQESSLDGVNLLTAHSAKGLEFPYVFIVKSSNNNWGNTRRMPTLLLPEIYLSEDEIEISDKEQLLEDERRLFFVAMTRAKEKIYITYANEYESNGSVSQTEPTQFIAEIDKSFLKFNETKEDTSSAKDLVTLIKSAPNPEYSKQEEQFLRKQLEKFKLSATALNTYIESPLLFKERFLIHVPQIKTKELALGTAIHKALETFNRGCIKGKVTTLQEMINIFAITLKKEFYADEQYQVTLDEGTTLITDYYPYLKEITIPEKIIMAEYNFGSHNIPFELKDGQVVRLTGKLDRLEKIDDENVRIIDYKVSKPKTEGDIKGTTKASNGSIWRQLVFYTLLANEDHLFRPDRDPNKPKYLCSEVAIDFIRKDKYKNDYKRSQFSPTSSDIEELKELINTVMNEINSLNFPEEPTILL